MGANDLSLMRVNLKTKFKKMKKMIVFGQPLEISPGDEYVQGSGYVVG